MRSVSAGDALRSEDARDAGTKGATPLPRIGLVATDAVRIAGLQAILRDGERFTVVLHVGCGSAWRTALELVFIDSSATEHCSSCSACFDVPRPQVAVIVLGAETDFEHIERVIGAGAQGYLNHRGEEARCGWRGRGDGTGRCGLRAR